MEVEVVLAALPEGQSSEGVRSGPAKGKYRGARLNYPLLSRISSPGPVLPGNRSTKTFACGAMTRLGLALLGGKRGGENHPDAVCTEHGVYIDDIL
jgi:hypothetical protein